MTYKINTIFSFIFSLFILSCAAQTKTALNAEEFEKEINSKNNIQLLDVRTPGEFFSGHIDNALQADWTKPNEFDRRISFLDKAKPTYVYCLSGGRSAAAAAKLRTMGYESVYELTGGTNAWKAAGKTLSGAGTQPQMSLEEFNTAISGDKPVLVDFGAAWCPPCKKMEPIITKLISDNPDKFKLVKVDGGRDQDILQQYKVTALPVFIVFKNGKLVWRKDDLATGEELEKALLN